MRSTRTWSSLSLLWWDRGAPRWAPPPSTSICTTCVSKTNSTLCTVCDWTHYKNTIFCLQKNTLVPNTTMNWSLPMDIGQHQIGRASSFFIHLPGKQLRKLWLCLRSLHVHWYIWSDQSFVYCSVYMRNCCSWQAHWPCYIFWGGSIYGRQRRK